jgi:hypothetical protein
VEIYIIIVELKGMGKEYWEKRERDRSMKGKEARMG